MQFLSDCSLRGGKRTWLAAALLALLVCFAPAATAATKKVASKTVSKSTSKTVKAAPVATVVRKARPAAPKRATPVKRRRRASSRWLVPTYVDHNGVGDLVEGDDPRVRQAAVEALGTRNGTVVVVDPQTGRVLTVVNQELAFSRGFQPCSTFKMVVGLGALAEGIIGRDTPVKISRRVSLNLTEALAKSNNPYFAKIGSEMGFEKVHSYANLFGLGEKATLNVDREQPGALTTTPPAIGGVGYMSVYGEGIQLTVMQLAALTSAFANGGTLYHLQYPQTQFEAATLEPHIKRQLAIGQWIGEMKPGMMGAVEFGTARRAGYSADEPILAKTGTCTDRATPTHLGWFASFNDVAAHKLAVVVLLTGGSRVSGPEASAIGGDIYRRLSERQYFASTTGGGSSMGNVLALGGE